VSIGQAKALEDWDDRLPSQQITCHPQRSLGWRAATCQQKVDGPRERFPEGDLMIYVFCERPLSRQWLSCGGPVLTELRFTMTVATWPHRSGYLTVLWSKLTKYG